MTQELRQLSAKRRYLVGRWRLLVGGGLPLALLAASLAVGGCGGGSSSSRVASSSSSAASLSRAQLVARADAICARVNAEVAGLRPKVASPLEFAVVVPRSAVFQQRAVRELSALTPPPAIAVAWRQLVAYRRELADGLVALAGQRKGGDARGGKGVPGPGLLLPRTLVLAAERDGLKGCLVSGYS
jgi:hypothetical protein